MTTKHCRSSVDRESEGQCKVGLGIKELFPQANFGSELLIGHDAQTRLDELSGFSCQRTKGSPPFDYWQRRNIGRPERGTRLMHKQTSKVPFYSTTLCTPKTPPITLFEILLEFIDGWIFFSLVDGGAYYMYPTCHDASCALNDGANSLKGCLVADSPRIGETHVHVRHLQRTPSARVGNICPIILSVGVLR
jgi:hypothetical protein